MNFVAMMTEASFNMFLLNNPRITLFCFKKIFDENVKFLSRLRLNLGC